MPWIPDDDEINGLIDNGLKDSPPNPPMTNKAASLRVMLKAMWAAIRTQITGAVTAAETAKTDAETALGAMQDGIPKGPWNAGTNSPTLTATPNAGFPDGSYYENQVTGTLPFATINYPIGTAVNKGDKLKKLGTQWYLALFGVGDGSITTVKIQDDAITKNKSAFLVPGKNKLDISKVVEGMAVDNSGNIVAAATYSITRLPCLPNTQYTLSGTMGYAAGCRIRFENASQGFISVYNANSANFSTLPATFTTPTNCYFMVINTKTGSTVSYNTLQIELGAAASAWEAYERKLEESDMRLSSYYKKTEADVAFATLSIGKNKLDISKVVEGMAVDNLGGIVANAAYSITRLPCLPSTQYTFSGVMQNPSLSKIRFENAGQGFISVYNANSANFSTLPATFTTPANCYFMVVNTRVTGTVDYNTLQIELGAVATAYEAYSRKVEETDMRLPSYYKKTEADAAFAKADTIGKNKLDISKVVEGYAVSNTGSIVTTALSYSIVTVEGVLPSTQYTYSGTMQSTVYARIRFENAAGGFLGFYNPEANGITALPFSFTTPANCTRMVVNAKSGGTANYATLQIEIGATATAYQAYQVTIPPHKVDYSGVLTTATLPYKGKKAVFFGDSITFNNTYQPLIQAVHDFSYANNAVSGSCIATGKEDIVGDGTTRPALVTRASAVNALAGDVIIVFAGTNDWIYSVPIGTISDSVTTTFYGALKNLVTSLQAGNVAKKIVFCTPLQRTNSRANYAGQKAYRDAILDVCGQYAVPVLDLFAKSGITYENIGQFTSDNVHPTPTVGAPYLAKVMSSFLFTT